MRYVGKKSVLLSGLLAACASMPSGRVPADAAFTGRFGTEPGLSCLWNAQGPMFPASAYNLYDREPSLASVEHLLALSWISYLEPKVAQQLARDLGYPKTEFFVRRHADLVNVSRLRAQLPQDHWVFADSEAMWAEDDQKVVIAFRGTEAGGDDNLDVVTDLLAQHVGFLKPFPTPPGELALPWDLPLATPAADPPPDFGQVHLGFYSALALVWEDIARKIQAMPTPKPILITGHSLGAAEATLAFARLMIEQQRLDEKMPLAQQPFQLRGLVTFGSPRVGDIDFRNDFELLFAKLNQRASQTPGMEGLYVKRYVDLQDPVTTLPTYGTNYWHVGDLMYLDVNSILTGLAAKLHAPHLGYRAARQLSSSVGNHYLSSYVTQMEKSQGRDLKPCFLMNNVVTPQ